MKKVENFIKIVVWTNIMIAVMLVVDLLAMTYFGVRSDAGLARFSAANLSGEIGRTVNENGEICYSMSRQGTDRIDDFHGFAFILDDAGDGCGVISCRTTSPDILR